MAVSLPFIVDLLLVIGVAGGWLVYWYLTNNFNYWKDRGVPFVKPHWFFGNVGHQVLQRKSCTEFAKNLYNKFKDTGYGGLFLFRKPVIFVCDLGLIEKILTQDFSHFEDRSVACNPEEPLSDTLFNASGDKWRNMRHKLTTTFSSVKVKGMFNQVFNCADCLIKEIEECSKRNKLVEIEPLAFNFATEVIASCVCGVQLMTDPVVGKKFRESLDILFQFPPLKLAKSYIGIVYPELFRRLKIKYTPSSVENFFVNLTEETIKYRKQNDIKRNDFLQMMINLKEQEEDGNSFDSELQNHELQQNGKLFSTGKCFTDKSIPSLVFNFLAAGTKPSASTLSLTMFEIAKNSSIQQRLQEEVESCIAKHHGFNYQAISEMGYLDQIIQETHRMYTFQKVLTRLVTKNYTIPGTDVVLEKGTIVYIPISAIHMDPKFYPEPEVFDPERFAGNNYKPSCRFLPYGYGPRICIGVKFVALLMKVFVARIVIKYSIKLEMNPSIEWDGNICAPQPKNGIWLSFHNRE